MDNMHPDSHTSTSGFKLSLHAPKNTRGYSQVDSSPESNCEHSLEHATDDCLESQMQPDPYPKSPRNMLKNCLEGLGSFTQKINKLKAQESNEVCSYIMVTLLSS